MLLFVPSRAGLSFLFELVFANPVNNPETLAAFRLNVMHNRRRLAELLPQLFHSVKLCET